MGGKTVGSSHPPHDRWLAMARGRRKLAHTSRRGKRHTVAGAVTP
jgi:hypothetical protein